MRIDRVIPELDVDLKQLARCVPQDSRPEALAEYSITVARTRRGRVVDRRHPWRGHSSEHPQRVDRRRTVSLAIRPQAELLSFRGSRFVRAEVGAARLEVA